MTSNSDFAAKIGRSEPSDVVIRQVLSKRSKMEGADNNLSQSDTSTLKSLQEQLFAVKIENSGFDKLKRASKAGVALLQNPKIDQYAQSLGKSPAQYKTDVKQQIGRLESRAQQVQADREQEPETTEDSMPPTVATAATPATVAEEAAKEDPSVPREGEEGRMNEDDAREEATKVQELAKGNDGKPSGDDYKAASDLVDEQKQKEKEKPREGEPANRMSLDESRADVAKNGGGNSKAWQKDPTQKLKTSDDKYKASGGRAIQSRSSQIRDGLNAVKDPKKQFEKQAEKAVATAAGKGAATAMTAAGLGALAGAADAATKWATEKALPWLKKNKSWLMTPAFMIIILFGSVGAGIAGSLMQRDGRNGGTAQENIDPTNQGDVANIRELLGQGYKLNGNIGDWYYRQNSTEEGQDWAGDNRGNMSHVLGTHGCVITALAMMAKYYGLNVTPVTVAPACNPNSHTCFFNWIATALKSTNRKWVTVPTNINSIRAVLANGDPVFAYGTATFGSKGPHAVVIVGVTDQGTLVLNDPMHGSGFRFQFEPEKITEVKAFVK